MNPPITDILDSNLKEKLAWLLRLRKRYRVKGASMVPTLKEGDTVLVNLRAYRSHPPQPDDVVMALHPNLPDQKIFKRVQFVNEYGRVYLIGDNKTESNDSRDFGPLAPECILGRVSSRFK